MSFTTPSSGVVLDKGLRLRVLSKFGSIPGTACDIGSYGQAEDYTVYFSNNNNIWTGAINTDWSIAGNWSKAVPISSSIVTIPSAPSNQPHITTSAISPSVCNNLTIDFGSVVTLDAGKALSVNGTLTNNA